MISLIPPKPRSQIWSSLRASSMNLNISKMVFSVAIISFSVKLTVSFNRLNTVAVELEGP